MQRAFAVYGERRLPEAEALFAQVLRAKPDHYEALLATTDNRIVVAIGDHLEAVDVNGSGTRVPLTTPRRALEIVRWPCALDDVRPSRNDCQIADTDFG